MLARPSIDYTSRDYEGFRADMLKMLKEKIPEYTDFSQSDPGVVLVELLAHGLDVLSYYNDKVANEVFPETAMERESIIRHSRRLGYELRPSIPSRYYQVFKIIPQESDYTLPKGLKLYTKGEDRIDFETIETLTIPAGKTGIEQDEKGNYLYKVVVEQGNTVESDIVGSSNGSPYQEFLLNYKPIIIDSLQVFVKDDFYNERWERVKNFIDSDFESKVFATETTESDDTKLLFGSGNSGMIPPIYENGISATYRIGGGVIGNVAINMITELTQKPAIVIETFNVEQIQKGVDKESIEEARINAPLSLKTLWRAVTLEDYENLLVMEFNSEIIRVRAKAEDDRFTISVYVLTENDVIPELDKQRYLEFLDGRKEIGYDVKILDPNFVDLDLTLNVITTKAHLNNEIKSSVEEYVKNTYTRGYLNFGEEFLESNLISNVMQIYGVRDVKVTSLGTTKPTNIQIIKVKNITVNVTGGI